MKHGMLRSTHIFIDILPIIQCIWTRQCIWIRIIHITKIIPTRSSPLWHRIRLTFSMEVFSEFYIEPIWNGCKWRLPIPCWFVFLNGRKCERKTRINDEFPSDSIINLRKYLSSDNQFSHFSMTQHPHSIFSFFWITLQDIRKIHIGCLRYICNMRKFFHVFDRKMNKGNWFSPIPLTRKEPISELVVYFFMTKSFDLCFLCEGLASFRRLFSIKLS